MNDNQLGLMEEDILQEENLQEEANQTNQKKSDPKKPSPSFNKILPNLKDYLLHFKGPKMISIVILLILLITIYFALALLSTGKKEEVFIDTIFDSQSPTPQITVDPQLAEITAKVENYNKKLLNTQKYSEKLPSPNIDLEITFSPH